MQLFDFQWYFHSCEYIVEFCHRHCSGLLFSFVQIESDEGLEVVDGISLVCVELVEEGCGWFFGGFGSGELGHRKGV
jgi:hypothetical protein